MILTDREIQIAIQTGAIIVDPDPDLSLYSSTSLDLTLDGRLTLFKEPKGGLAITIDPSDPKYNHEEILGETTSPHDIDAALGYDFKPGQMLLAWTREYVELKSQSRIAARVEGKSSLARLGIGIHLTAPTIHAGFSGQIRLEMVNHNKFPIKLRPGMKICQLIFEQTVGTPVRGYEGRFAGQTNAKKG
ncbi:dCTP deaminase (plasmid) [Sinorhizobium garamanticum]|uniref:dCTP deaminase n=1 Tax=Sinorhizobium garamanticum TaxID=680247 RepID=A0ABY8DLB7_9HYPH|nr:dCTP deaminase [Sinorhizobium garamanticum]WEX91701.1 dCTP deaminase [Sinorhizobium garamanticum]